MTTIGLGMPAPPRAHPGAPPQDPSADGPRRRRRKRLSDLGAVDVHHQDARRQHHASADRRADRGGLQHRPGGLPAAGGRRRARRDRAAFQPAGDRRHPLPAEVHLRGDRCRLCGGARQPRQHQGVRRPRQRGREGRGRRRHPDPHRRQRRIAGHADDAEVRQGHPGGAGRVGAVGGVAVRGARLRQYQDQRQAQRPRGDGGRLRAAGRASATTRCTSASPRPARRSRAPSSRPSRSARCCPRGSATPSGSRCRPRPSKRSRSATRSWNR